MPTITFTQVTATNCDLTKRYSINEQGQIESTAIAHMTEGHARICSIDDVTDLDAILRNLTPHQAITCGVPRVGDTALTTRAGAEFRPNAVARTNEAFDWTTGAALCPVDVDVDGGDFVSVGAVLDALEACHPWLAHITRVARPSSSSFVGGRGLRGVHVYFAVTRGVDIPDLAKRMQAEQWLANRGSVKISKSGALLVRQLSDALVYQPSRLMFEANPVLTSGVLREIPEDQAFVVRATRPIGPPLQARTPEGLLDATKLKPLRDIDIRRYETLKRDAKNARRREAKKIAIDYQRANAIANGFDATEGDRLGLLATRALGDHKLPATWTIFVNGIGRQTVEQIVAALPISLGFQCADPFDAWRPDLEPRHCTKAEIVLMHDKPGVWSHKLQEFFEFTNDSAAELASPLDMAAEKLCGLVEYPEPAGKKSAPLVNITHGVSLLLREIGCAPRFNASTYATDLDDVPEVGDLLDALSRIGCHNVSKKPIEDAIETLAHRNRVDPWKDAVLALPIWDKVPRLDTFFTDLCGALPADALTLTGQVLFAGIIMRQLKPGAPCPIVPVLIGKGGTGKTRFVHSLAQALGVPPPPTISFADEIKMTMAASVSAIVELGEMSGLAKQEIEHIKAWITECQDVYRGPYERRAVAHPRRFVPIGTANKHELNRDEEGNRRCMPVMVEHRIDPNWIVEAPQIFAEAKARFCTEDGDYERLIQAAADAVFDYNQEDMKRGIGTIASDMDDVLPDLLRHLVRQSDGRIKGSQIRAALDATPSGRAIKTREYTKWLTARGWTSGRTTTMRYYVPPKDFVDNEENKPLLSVVSPFTTEKTA